MQAGGASTAEAWRRRISMRSVYRSLFALAVIGLSLAALPALAGVPKVVVAEEFGATW